jgi:Avidin family
VTQGDIGGVWCNELGSKMELEPSADGRLSGSYVLAVAGGPAGPQPLVGFFDAEPDGASAAVSFTVAWPTSHTITTWLGGYQPDDEVITTTWLFTTPMGDQRGWRPIMVGSDVFRRSGPSGAGE